MRHAREDYERFQDPEGKIPGEEPVFIIRGQDIVGAGAVRDYARRAADAGADPELVRRCYDHAGRMDAWPKKKVPDLAKPDTGRVLELIQLTALSVAAGIKVSEGDLKRLAAFALEAVGDALAGRDMGHGW